MDQNVIIKKVSKSSLFKLSVCMASCLWVSALHRSFEKFLGSLMQAYQNMLDVCKLSNFKGVCKLEPTTVGSSIHSPVANRPRLDHLNILAAMWLLLNASNLLQNLSIQKFWMKPKNLDLRASRGRLSKRFDSCSHGQYLKRRTIFKQNVCPTKQLQFSTIFEES